MAALLVTGSVGIDQVNAQAAPPMTSKAAELDPFEQRVRAYLLKNPEVIMEVMQILQERQRDAGGLLVGFILDQLGFQRSAIGQWLVRTLSGEGESIFAVRARLAGKVGSMAEAYGWGKLLGMIFPWVADAGSRLAGVDVYGWQGFYIPYLYAMSDQIGASAAGLVFLRRRERGWLTAAAGYIRHPVMLASLGVMLIVPAGLLGARLLGFSPTTQVYTAIETIAANLCWVPPLVGWLRERKGQDR